jgi:hypothetical protein
VFQIGSFSDGKADLKFQGVIGWVLTASGALFILDGIIANMHMYFQPHQPLQYDCRAGPARRLPRADRALHSLGKLGECQSRVSGI